MDFPQTKKMRDLRIGDVFIRDIFTYVVVNYPYYGTVWVTKPEFVNEEGIYDSATLLQYKPDEQVKVIGQNERPPKLIW